MTHEQIILVSQIFSVNQSVHFKELAWIICSLLVRPNVITQAVPSWTGFGEMYHSITVSPIDPPQ